MRKDLHNHVKAMVAKNPTTISTDTTTAGVIIDTKGYGAVEFMLYTGTRTDGTYTPLIEEGNNSGLNDAVAVDDANLFGTEAAAALAASNSVSKVGYRVGKYRYVRLSVVSASTSSGCTSVGALATLSNADQEPVA